MLDICILTLTTELEEKKLPETKKPRPEKPLIAQRCAVMRLW